MSKSKFSYLSLAISNKKIESISFLISKGARVDLPEKHSPLKLACLKCPLPVVQMLIEKGADVKKADSIGATALHVASSLEIAKVLVRHGADVNAKLKPKPNAPEYEGRTPLHLAALNRHKGIVKFLISKKADANAVDWKGQTPLDYSMSEEISAILRKHGGKTGSELSTKK